MKVAEKTEAGSSKGKVSASKVLDDDQQEKLATEKAIETALGLKAKLIVGPKTKVLSIYFETMEQLDSLLSKLTT
jgi:hypothetical protein